MQVGLPVKIGSCDYNADDLLPLIPAEDWEKYCPEGQPQKTPLKIGHYGSHDPNSRLTIELDDISAIEDLLPLIKGKTVHAKAEFETAGGDKMACFENDLKIAK